MLFCFFFQAEDGIRDIGVTGVQTCALPISSSESLTRMRLSEIPSLSRLSLGTLAWVILAGCSMRLSTPPRLSRSEERRVGKECRSRGVAQHEKKIDIRYQQQRGSKRITSEA